MTGLKEEGKFAKVCRVREINSIPHAFERSMCPLYEVMEKGCKQHMRKLAVIVLPKGIPSVVTRRITREVEKRNAFESRIYKRLMCEGTFENG